MAWRGPAPPFYPNSEFTALDRCALSEILPRLYLTNYRGADDVKALKQIGCTHIAAVGEEFVNDQKEGIQFWRQDISDDEHQGGKMAKELRGGAAFVHNALKKRKAVSASRVVHIKV